MKSGIKTVAVTCNCCGADDTEFVTQGTEHEYDDTTDDVFTVVRCRRCGLYYLNPRPDVSELPTIYPPGYYAYHLQNLQQQEAPESNRSLLYRARRYIYVSRLVKALELCPKSPTLKVLDVGCADGRALNWYRQVDTFKVETYGVDFDEVAVERARLAGHQVFLGRFEEADIPLDMFDLVVATHVIEHVADPRDFAAKAHKVLKPGGIFLCETPNADSADASWFKNKHWGGYHFPRHWVFYTPESIRTMATGVGFEVVRIDFHPAPAFWNWTFHSMFRTAARSPHPLLRPFSKQVRAAGDWLFPPVDFQKNNFKNFCAAGLFTIFDIVQKALTGQTSNMAVILRKRAD
jgi:2-polyprenyl-3-methyl-5-hydroxy-6-metoxy-1,4-benzoquinol methylase